MVDWQHNGPRNRQHVEYALTSLLLHRAHGRGVLKIIQAAHKGKITVAIKMRAPRVFERGTKQKFNTAHPHLSPVLGIGEVKVPKGIPEYLWGGTIVVYCAQFLL